MLWPVASASTQESWTSSSEPSSPWPYSEMRAGVSAVAVLGTMHSNVVVATLPAICVGVASGLEEL